MSADKDAVRYEGVCGNCARPTDRLPCPHCAENRIHDRIEAVLMDAKRHYRAPCDTAIDIVALCREHFALLATLPVSSSDLPEGN